MSAPDIRDLECQMHDLCHMAMIAAARLGDVFTRHGANAVLPKDHWYVDGDSANCTLFSVYQTLAMAQSLREAYLAAAFPNCERACPPKNT